MDYANRPLVHRLMKFKEGIQFPSTCRDIKMVSYRDCQPICAQRSLMTLLNLKGLMILHQPEGVIEEAEQKLTDFYRSDKSFFLINGSTVGNLAMVYATCTEDETVIVQRNAHKSIFNAIELTGARPVFISPEWDSVAKTAGTGISETS